MPVAPNVPRTDELSSKIVHCSSSCPLVIPSPSKSPTALTYNVPPEMGLLGVENEKLFDESRLIPAIVITESYVPVLNVCTVSEYKPDRV